MYMHPITEEDKSLLTGFVAANDKEILHNDDSDVVVWNKGDPDLYDVELKSFPYSCFKHSWVVHWDLSNNEEVNFRYIYQLQIYSLRSNAKTTDKSFPI